MARQTSLKILVLLLLSSISSINAQDTTATISVSKYLIISEALNNAIDSILVGDSLIRAEKGCAPRASDCKLEIKAKNTVAHGTIYICTVIDSTLTSLPARDLGYIGVARHGRHPIVFWGDEASKELIEESSEKILLPAVVPATKVDNDDGATDNYNEFKYTQVWFRYSEGMIRYIGVSPLVCTP